MANYANGYAYRRTYIVDHTKVSGSADLTNYPVLFKQTNASFKTTANSGKVTSSSGYDIIFCSDEAGSTKLDFEIEYWSATTGELVAWIEVPTLSYTVDTTIYMFYGNSGVSTAQQNKNGTWHSGFKAVYHCNEASGNLADSTSTGATLTAGGTGLYQQTGAIKYGVNSNTSGYWYKSSAIASNTSEANVTIEVLAKVVTFNQYGILFFLGKSGYIFIRANSASTNIEGTCINSNNNTYTKTLTGLSTGTWYLTYLRFVKNDGLYLQINGSDQTKVSAANYYLTASTQNDQIGAYAESSQKSAAIIDEVRYMFGTSFNSDWGKTDYANIINNSTFAALGNETVPTSTVTTQITQSLAYGVWLPKVQLTKSLQYKVKSPFAVLPNTKYRTITVDHTKVPANYTDFNLLIKGTYTYLKSTSNSGSVAYTDGSDIYVTDSSYNLLPFKLQSYDPTTGAIVVWVKTTVSSTADTVVNLFYGDTTKEVTYGDQTQVFSGHTLVAHLDDTPIGTTGDIIDATGNNVGTSNSMDSNNSVTGTINKGLRIKYSSDTNEYINFGDIDLDGASAATFQAIVNVATLSDYANFFIKESSSTNRVAFGLAGGGGGGNNDLNAIVANGSNELRYTNANLISTSTSYLLHMIYDGSQTGGSRVKFVLNGVEQTGSGSTSLPATLPTNSASLYLGKATADTSQFDGILEEFRITKSAMTVAQCLTEYNNYFSPSTFYSVSSENTYQAPISVTDFSDGRVFQKNGTSATIIISGTYGGTPTSIQARVVEDGTSTEVVTWTTIDDTLSGGTFSGTLSVPQGGWYNVQVRFSNNYNVYANGTNAWGVGYVIAIGGQSNPLGWFENGTDVTPNSLLSYYYDGAWGFPTVGNGATTFGNAIISETSLPVGLVNFSVGATTIQNWIDDYNGIYTAFQTIMDTVGYIDGLIWWQGEQDGITGNDYIETTYREDMATLFGMFRTDAPTYRSTLPIFVGQTGRYNAGSDAATDRHWYGVRMAQVKYCLYDDVNAFLAFTACDLDMGEDPYHYTNASYTITGDRCAQTYNYFLGNVTYSGRGPMMDYITKIDSTHVDVHIDHSGTDYTPTSSIPYFRLFEDSTEKSITAAQWNNHIIRLTSSSSIGTGTLTVKYKYGANPGTTNTVKDNTTLTLPLVPFDAPPTKTLSTTQVTKSLAYAVKTANQITKQLKYQVAYKTSQTKELNYKVNSKNQITKDLQYQVYSTSQINLGLSYGVSVVSIEYTVPNYLDVGSVIIPLGDTELPIFVKAGKLLIPTKRTIEINR